MTTQPKNEYWSAFQASAVTSYTFEDTEIVSSSDGDTVYSSEKFKEAFPSHFITYYINQILTHVVQTIKRTFGYKPSEFKKI